jgi:4-amino-4-deoxy-L-arabinose transferase-like glycosyltransferase
VHDRSRSRATVAVVLSVFCVALAIRLAFCLTLKDTLYWSDEREYMKGVSRILDKGIWYLVGSYKPPGYVYFLTFVRLAFGESLMAIRAVQSVLGALACVLTFTVATGFFSRRVAIAAAAYATVYPLLIYVCGVALPQALETVLILGFIMLLVTYRDSAARRYLVMAGLLLGLGALTVPLVLGLLPVAGLWFLSMRGGRLGPALRETVLLGALALCMILPWTVRNYVVEHRFILIATLGSQLLYLHNNPWSDPDDRERTREMAFKIRREVNAEAKANPEGPTEDEIYLRRFEQFVSDHPGRFAVIYLKKFRNFFSPMPSTFSDNPHTSRANMLVGALSYAPVLAFSIVGTIVALRRRRQALVLAAVPIFFALGYSLFHTTVRYRIPTEPCSIILAAFGILWLASRVGIWRGEVLGGAE